MLALWAVMLLAAIASGALATVRSESSMTDASVRRLQADALADAGIRYGVYIATTIRPQANVWAPRRASLQLHTGMAEVTVSSEHGRIDLNQAAEALLLGLASALGGADGEALGKALVARREGKSVPRRAFSATPDIAPRRVYLSVEELLDLPGVTRDVYLRLAGAVTVYSGRKGVDVLSAPRAALLALPGATAANVDDFLAQRAAVHGNVRVLGELVRLAHELFPQARRYLITRRPTVFSIAARVRLVDGTRSTRRAVVRLQQTTAGPYAVLSYGDATVAIPAKRSTAPVARWPAP